MIAETVSEAPHVMDVLMHYAHQKDLRIVEHYATTAGATDHVFSLCHLLGFRFTPRIKDLEDRKLYAVQKAGTYPLLEALLDETIDTGAVAAQWAELVRLKVSIEAGSIAPSVVLRKLAAATGNVLSRGLRAVGRIERTLFTLQSLSDPGLLQQCRAQQGRGQPIAHGAGSAIARARSATLLSRTRVFGRRDRAR